MLKVVIIGDSHVGKTSMRNRFVLDKFSFKTRSTVGADFVSKDVELSNGDKVTLQLWDTAGQERFQSISSAYYRGADACILMYDVTDPTSLANLVTWQKDFMHYARIEDVASFPFVIVANKIDCKDDRQISPAQGVKAAQVLKDISVELEEPSTERLPFNTLNDDHDTGLRPPTKAMGRINLSRGFLGLKSMRSRMSREEVVHELDSFPTFKSNNLSNKASVLSFYSATSQITSYSKATSDDGSEDTITPGDISGEWTDTVNGHAYFECSASTGEKIDRVFHYIASVAKPATPSTNSFSLQYHEVRDEQPRGLMPKNKYSCC